MKIAVIGAGIAGICTAYELAMDGHSVAVFERNAAVAEESSFACGGNQSPSLSHALAFPAPPASSRLRSLLTDSGVTVRAGSSMGDLRWLLRWKTPPADWMGKLACAQQLAHYSQERQLAISTQESLVYEQAQGQLLLFQSAHGIEACQEKVSELNRLGAAARALSADEARKLEPALGADLPLHGAVYFPNDGVGNCRQFAHALKDRALAMGVVFHFGTPVTGLVQGATVRIRTASLGDQGFDQVVVCAGTGASPLLGAALKRIPLTRLWSYSLSAQIREPLNAPRSAVFDSHSRMSINRIGTRVRVCGGAELGGAKLPNHAATVKRMYQTLQSHFPGAVDFGRSAQIWRGASIFSPDALPLLGPSAAPGIWLNLAHGHNGWSQACGAARLLADQLKGQPAALDTRNLQPDRFNS
jgi:D-amino-acid dehydrogenase